MAVGHVFHGCRVDVRGLDGSSEQHVAIISLYEEEGHGQEEYETQPVLENDSDTV